MKIAKRETIQKIMLLIGIILSLFALLAGNIVNFGYMSLLGPGLVLIVIGILPPMDFDSDKWTLDGTFSKLRIYYMTKNQKKEQDPRLLIFIF